MVAKRGYYDTSDYPKEHTLYSTANKKVLGKMKDEWAGITIEEVVCLRSKMYSVLKVGEKNIKKAKGVKKCVIKKHINHENFKETLFGGKQSMHEMQMLRSEGHDMYSIKMKKVSLTICV